MNKYIKYLTNYKKNILFNKNIEYITNYKYFYTKKIKIFYPILTPRHETEKLVYIAKKILKNEKAIPLHEIGYGSNNINKVIKEKHKYTGVDINFIGFLTKEKSIKKNYTLSDWKFISFFFKKFNLIITNPPYIEKKELNMYEKEINIKKSLFSNNNGLNLTKNITKISKNILFKNGILLMEHDYYQNKKIRNFSKLNGFIAHSFYDCNKLKRFIYIEI